MRLLLLIVCGLAGCTASDSCTELELSGPDINIPSIATIQDPIQAAYYTGNVTFSNRCHEQADKYPHEPNAIRWLIVPDGEKASDVYFEEARGNIDFAWNSEQDVPNANVIFYTCGSIPDGLGVQLPFHFWELHDTLWLDFYIEENQQTSMQITSGMVVFAEFPDDLFQELNARYLGEFESDGW